MLCTHFTKRSLQESRNRIGSFKLDASNVINLYNTPDYKDLQVELEWTETCYTSFLSLKRPNFKNVIFKILEVAASDSPAK